MTGDAPFSISKAAMPGSAERRREYRPTVEHRLKSWPQFFERILSGEKTHELRRGDRDFLVGDILRLQEFDPCKNQYTGRECSVLITYITSTERPCALSQDALHPDYCILSIKQL
jgi:hypothetical protein